MEPVAYTPAASRFGKVPEQAAVASGGRTWWAHCEFTRINIERTILHKKIEDLQQLGAFMFTEAAWCGQIVGEGL